jgi:hypothetical protein
LEAKDRQDERLPSLSGRAGAFLLRARLTRFDEFRGSAKRTVGLVRLDAQSDVGLTEQTIALGNVLEGLDEFVQQFQALRLGRLCRFGIRLSLFISFSMLSAFEVVPSDGRPF